MIESLLSWMNPIELAATIFGLMSVGLTVRQNTWCWPTGLIMVALYIHVFYEARLYSDMGLQVVYVFMQIYGWHYWVRGAGAAGGDAPASRPVTRLTPVQFALTATVGALGIGGLGFLMARYTDADLAYWDAATTVLSLIAQWFMGRKTLDSWVFWITVDVLAIGIYMYKGLYLTGGLYVVFLGLAVAGLFEWLKSYRAHQQSLGAYAV